MAVADAKHRLAALLMRHAMIRLSRKHPEWAEAMAAESATLLSDDERLAWASGCAVASYRAPGAFDWVIYPMALLAGVTLMTAYQWSADESLKTVGILALIGLALGVLQPRRSMISGAAIGVVVALVNGFETITGLRPAYETTAHTILHDVRWAVFIIPALGASLIGRYVGQKLRSGPGVL
jgi:hypothetical protein